MQYRIVTDGRTDRTATTMSHLHSFARRRAKIALCCYIEQTPTVIYGWEMYSTLVFHTDIIII